MIRTLTSLVVTGVLFLFVSLVGAQDVVMNDDGSFTFSANCIPTHKNEGEEGAVYTITCPPAEAVAVAENQVAETATVIAYEGLSFDHPVTFDGLVQDGYVTLEPGLLYTFVIEASYCVRGDNESIFLQAWEVAPGKDVPLGSGWVRQSELATVGITFPKC